MEMSFTQLLTASLGLVAIGNPLLLLGPFLTITKDYPDDIRNRTARRVGLVAFVVMALTAWLGKGVLFFFGLGVPQLQMAAGLVLLLLGVPMFQGPASKVVPEGSESDPSQWRSTAVVPLTIPLSVGAGTMAFVITQTVAFPGVRDIAAITGVGFAVAVLVALVLLFAGPIKRVLGNVGVSVLSRIMGILLMALGFGLLTAGLRELLPGLA